MILQKLNLDKDTIKEHLVKKRVSYYVCLLSVAILPVYSYYLPPVMILWGLIWLYENKFRISIEMFRNNNAAMVLVALLLFYAWQISGLVFADSLGSGLERIVKRLSYILFPLVLFWPGDLIKNRIKQILKVYAVFVLIYLLYCLIAAIFRSVSITDGHLVFNSHPAEFDYESYFLSNRFSSPAHPVYLSMYVILASLVSFDLTFDKTLGKMKRLFWLFVSFIFLTAIFLLSSRAGMVAMIIVIPPFVLIKLYRKYARGIVFLPVLILIAVFVVIAKRNERVIYAFENVKQIRIKTLIERDSRFPIWNSAAAVISKNPVLGVGTGDASAELKKEFLELGYRDGYYNDLNSHNQYIEVLLENGVIGLLLFLSVFGIMIYIALAERNFVYLFYIFSVMIFFFFETMLNRLAGITFFSLFSFLLIHLHPATNEN